MEGNALDNFSCPICGTKLLWMPVSHIFVCEGCRETFSEDAKFYLHNYDEYIASKKSHGNVKAMREALVSFMQLADDGVIRPRSVGGADEHCFCVLKKKARAALSTPPRNCDVGTPEEQEERFTKVCIANSKDGVRGLCSETCPFDRDYQSECALAWAQMPYEAAVKGAGE